MEEKDIERLGWICPKCGRGVAPFAEVCVCQRENMIYPFVTSSEYIPYSQLWFYNDGQLQGYIR